MNKKFLSDNIYEWMLKNFPYRLMHKKFILVPVSYLFQDTGLLRDKRKKLKKESKTNIKI